MAGKDTTYISEKRSAKRIPAPVGTTALVTNSFQSLDTVSVRDMSAVGLLIDGRSSEEKYPVNTLINGIFLTIPPCELNANSSTCLFINKGKVVRSFFDQVSSTVWYGIELTNKSSHVKEMLEGLVNN
jgi:hypothetical protein